MNHLRFALLAAVLAGCHFDKLFTSTGAGGGPPAGSSPILSFTTQPSSATAGEPLPSTRVSVQDSVGSLRAYVTDSASER